MISICGVFQCPLLEDHRRRMKPMVYRTAKRCMELDGISCVPNEEFHDGIALIGQMGAQFNYKTMVIRCQ
jgi:hypothetical protein